MRQWQTCGEDHSTRGETQYLGGSGHTCSKEEVQIAPLHGAWAHITEIPGYPALATYGQHMAQMGVLLPCYG